jgi:hypothetical protein
MRFSIRDLLWVSLVVGLCLSLWPHHQVIDARREAADDRRAAAANQARRFRDTLVIAKEANEQLAADARYSRTRRHVHVGWHILNEPLVEP